ncbi:hypothetical protein [Paenibacillus sp. N3.4]|uniref:hypothetical protein n=1 Tax=Paenibacillus sp. N3.4 TaxID=2603222 RepID=UPI0011CB014E|nr:hypothetical protein [Paenibacillus sp. N3.4]TXK84835.1 hypothetical protein FU659_07210 [Paenibacillus sp. N3.4]
MIDHLLALTAGIMVAASVYGLIPTALKLSNLFVLCCGVLLGVLTLGVLEQYLPHVHINHSKTGGRLDAKSFLLIMSMSLHNLPEGSSIGVSYASQVESLGNVVAFRKRMVMDTKKWPHSHLSLDF